MKTNTFSIEYGVCSHIGKRLSNQDAILVTNAAKLTDGKGKLFAVADGMGGHSGGSLASRLACEGLQAYYSRSAAGGPKFSPMVLSHHLSATIFRTDRHIRLRGLKDKAVEDMGTTLSCLVLTGTHSIIAHVGDSRIYRLRRGHLTCLTVDHTFVQDMIFEGEVDPDKKEEHPLRHMLTRVVGTVEPLPLVDSWVDWLQINDRFLLCTDGLSNAVTEKSIYTLLSADSIASETAAQLVEKALQNGGRDNISVIVIQIKNRT